jgi:hypothetical protein
MQAVAGLYQMEVQGDIDKKSAHDHAEDER